MCLLEYIFPVKDAKRSEIAKLAGKSFLLQVFPLQITGRLLTLDMIVERVLKIMVMVQVSSVRTVLCQFIVFTEDLSQRQVLFLLFWSLVSRVSVNIINLSCCIISIMAHKLYVSKDAGEPECSYVTGRPLSHVGLFLHDCVLMISCW